MLQEWTEPPPMSPSAPAPAVLSTDGTLYLSYRIARDAQHCAVVRFDQVEEYAWGASPAAHGDDIPGALPRGSFYEVVTDKASAKGPERRWIITFPDALLDVRAASGEVVLRATAVVDPSHALAALLA
jgi:hypothetical protein